MNMRMFALIICSLLAVGLHATDALGILTGANSPLRFGDRIVFHGDSITAMSSAPEGFTSLLQRELALKRPELRVRVMAAGESGRKSSGLAPSLPYDVLDQQPSVVFIFIGVNDVWHWEKRFGGKGSSPEEYAAALRAEITAVEQAGAIAVLATPAVIGEKTDGSNDMRMAMTKTPPQEGDPAPADALLDKYADISRAVAREKGVVLCDLRAAFMIYLREHNPAQQFQGILTIDGVHLSAAGNRLVSEQAAQSIAAALRTYPWFLPLRDAVLTPVSSITLLGRNGSNAGLDIRFTLDGSMPTARSQSYTKAFNLTKTARLRILVTDKAGHTFTSAATYTVQALVFPDFLHADIPGLRYAIYDINSPDKLVPDLTHLTPVATGVFANPFFSAPKGLTSYAARLTGYLAIPADGVYTFTARSAFGSKLWIGKQLVVTHEYVGRKVSRAGEIALKAGQHSVIIDFYRQPSGDASQWFFIEGPKMPYQMIPDDMWRQGHD